MTSLAMFGLGVPELLIILAVLLLLFGGTRLAGLGKSTGRALKEFKEETKGLKGGDDAQSSTQYPPAQQPPAQYPPAQYPPAQYPPGPQSTTPPQVIGPPAGTGQQWPGAPQPGAQDTPGTDRRDG